MSDDFDLKICCMGAGYVGGPTMAVIAKMCPKVSRKMEVGETHGKKCGFPSVLDVQIWGSLNLVIAYLISII